MVKLKDYETGPEVTAPTPYAAYFALRDSDQKLELGDLLDRDGELRIYKFVGFELAQWLEPDLKKGPASETPAAAMPGSGALPGASARG